MYALSWRVWTYQELYPAIPFFSWVPYLGPVPAWALFAAMLGGFSLCLRGVRPGATCAVFVAASAALILQDQHRLQPWAYQFALCAAILSWADERERGRLMLWLTAGIYFHSGLQKLNYSFIEGTGAVLAGVLLKPLGVTTESLPFPLLAALTLGMGLWEVALAPGLLFRPTRRRAAWAAIAMHAVILFCLGPWGLSWNRVVWPWNLLMIAFNLQFARMDDEAATPAAGTRAKAARALLLAALTLPLLRFADRFDSYPAFGMYIDYYHQSDLYVLWEAQGRLPERVRRHLEKPAVDSLGRVWRRFNPIEWSVAELEVPPYMENRHLAGVAAALCERFQLGDSMAAEFGGLPSLRTGAKTTLRAHAGCAQVRTEADHYLFNARPVENLYRGTPPRFALRVPAPAPSERAGDPDASAAAARLPGSEPRGATRCLDAAAGFHAARHEFVKAETLYAESLALYAAAMPDDIGRRDALRSLAIVYAYEGRPADAERLFKDWREDARRRLGTETPEEAYALEALGLLAKAQGRAAQERELTRGSIALYRRLGRPK